MRLIDEVHSYYLNESVIKWFKKSYLYLMHKLHYIFSVVPSHLSFGMPQKVKLLPSTFKFFKVGTKEK